MSVILTAGKKSILKPRSAKPKKKKPAQAHASGTNAAFNSTPPMSSERTAVWHWMLSEVPVTIMFNKESNEVWCNGEVLETVDRFSHAGCGDGSVIDFYIALDDDGSAHRGRIERLPGGKGLNCQLLVDGYIILEHTTTQPLQLVPSEPALNPTMALPYHGAGPQYGAGAQYGGAFGIPGAAVYEPPPEYDAIIRADKKGK